MKVIIVTNMYPNRGNPVSGIFVKEQVEALRALRPEWAFEVLLVNGVASKWNYIRGMAAVHRRLRETQHDLIHAHYGLTGFVAAMERRAPLVVTYHRGDVWLWWQRQVSRLASRVAARNIFVSDCLAAKMPSPRALVLPCGVDLQLFQQRDALSARRELGLAPGKKVVLFPGNPSNRRKGYKLFKTVLEHLPYALRRATHVVPFVGIRRELVPSYVSTADAMVLASTSEGSPQVVKEAMACNLPVVSVDVGDVAHLLHGVACSYVCPREPRVLAERLREILERGERSTGRNRIVELGLDSESIASSLVQLYVDVRGEWLVRGRSG